MPLKDLVEKFRRKKKNLDNKLENNPLEIT
jgi:hypothetical protein